MYIFSSGTNIVLSRATGYVSLYIWIVSALPQIIENYQLKSGEGLAPQMFFIWLAGDVMNLVGGIRQDVVWTVVLTAAWYTLSEVIIILQIYYYRHFYKDPRAVHRHNQHHHQQQQQQLEGHVEHSPTENTGLLESRPLQNQSQATGHAQPAYNLYGYDEDGDESTYSDVSSTESYSTTLHKDILRTVGLILVVVVLPTVWELLHADISAPVDTPPVKIDVWAQVSAYLSALLYLSARFPQFIKNYRDKSTHGLSLGVFLLSVLGNITYAASILLYSVERTYLMANAPFLLGSLGTIVEDLAMFGQFYAYSGRTRELHMHGCEDSN
ncbi:hypothetical protein EV182_000629 [Spiromyces aspiralis]|uniref:Uncharacterized protein n=1 Tax=Spiromyces aspiralis TaxID=68401 RepID=A0ACC1HUL9_9FUNG|nr:hypothetical protein EV182_000629 [Spiromyces aspiralis]